MAALGSCAASCIAAAADLAVLLKLRSVHLCFWETVNIAAEAADSHESCVLSCVDPRTPAVGCPVPSLHVLPHAVRLCLIGSFFFLSGCLIGSCKQPSISSGEARFWTYKSRWASLFFFKTVINCLFFFARNSNKLLMLVV